MWMFLVAKQVVGTVFISDTFNTHLAGLLVVRFLWTSLHLPKEPGAAVPVPSVGSDLFEKAEMSPQGVI